MHPWKVFIRSVGVVTLLAMGGLAAGQNVVPFANASRSVGAQATVDETAADDDGAVTPAADEAPAPSDDTATTTDDAPPTAAPDIDPVETPETTPPVVEVTEAPDASDTPTTTAPPTAAPDTDAPDSAPSAPAEEEGPVVCAAAAASPCGPAEPELAADSSFDARVQRCQAWWNRLADRLEQRDRPRWAARARLLAERCDEWVARWQERREQREQQREQRREVRDERREDRRDDRRDNPRKVKGDHNHDGHPDNGWHNKDSDWVSRHSERRR